ncbi:MAG: hypothetical protein ACREC0_15540 [Methylocella sp.]
MKLSDIFPDVDVLIALEPEELGLRILPVLDDWERRHSRSSPLQLDNFLDEATRVQSFTSIGGYSPDRAGEIRQALREVWA